MIAMAGGFAANNSGFAGFGAIVGVGAIMPSDLLWPSWFLTTFIGHGCNNMLAGASVG
jgi:hypothetical protein